jgi:hypothetical protein
MAIDVNLWLTQCAARIRDDNIRTGDKYSLVVEYGGSPAARLHPYNHFVEQKLFDRDWSVAHWKTSTGNPRGSYSCLMLVSTSCGRI